MAEKLTIQIDGNVDDFVKKLNEAKKETSNVGEVLKKSAALAATAFTGIAAAAGFALNEARKIETLKTQFEVLTGSAAAASKIIKDLTEFSAKTPFQFEGIADASKQLLAFGFTADELPKKLQQIGDVASATGKPIEDIATIFGQVAAAGKLTGERLLQFQERAIPVGKAIAETMGVSETAVRKLVSEGKVSFSIFEKAFASLSKKGGFAFEGMIKQSKTLDGLISTAKDTISIFAADLGRELLPVAKLLTERFIAFAESLRNSSSTIETFKSALSGTLSIATFLKTSFENLGGVIGIGLAASVEAAKAAIDLNFKGAKNIIKDGAAEVGALLKSNNDQLNKDLAAIDNSFKQSAIEREKEQTQALSEELTARNAVRVDATTEAEEKAIEKSKEAAILREELALTEAEFRREQDAIRLEELETGLTQEQAIRFQAEENIIEQTLSGKEREDAIKQLYATKDEAREKTRLDQLRKAKAAEIQLEQMATQQKIALAQNAANFLVAVQGKQTAASLALGKAAAAANVLVQDGQARAAAVAAAAAAAPSAGPLAPARFAADLAYYNALITANTALSLGTIAAQTFQEYQAMAKGGIVTGGIPGKDSVPIMAQRKELVAPAKNFEEVIGSVRAKREADRLAEDGLSSGRGGTVNVLIGFDGDMAANVLTARQIEQRALGTSLEG